MTLKSQVCCRCHREETPKNTVLAKRYDYDLLCTDCIVEVGIEIFEQKIKDYGLENYTFEDYLAKLPTLLVERFERDGKEIIINYILVIERLPNTYCIKYMPYSLQQARIWDIDEYVSWHEDIKKAFAGVLIKLIENKLVKA